MNLQAINDQYIKISSVAFEKGYNANVLKELVVTGKLNMGIPITKSFNLVNATTTWKCDFTFTHLMYVKSIFVKNILTNQLYNLISTPLLVTTNNLVVIADQAETTLKTTLGIPLANVGAEYVSGVNGILFVSNLPTHLVMDSIVTTILDIERTIPFTFVMNPETLVNDVIINQDCIYLTSSFFGLTTLSDGIYNITTETILTDNTSLTEQTCLFVDLTLKGILYTSIDITQCNPHDMNILMMHYALNQASNNHCDCNKMYDIYNYIVNNITPNILEDCGC